MSLQFDGVNDYARNTTNPMVNTTDFTMGGWFKKIANPGGTAVLMQNGHNGGSGSGYEIRMTTGGAIRGDQAFVSGWTSTTTMNTTDWYHIALRRFDSRLRLWINGVLDAGGSDFATPNTPANGIWIGSGNNSGTPNRFWNGLAAECFCYNIPLLAEEIEALAKGFSPAFLPRGLVFYAPLIGRYSPEQDLARSLNLTVNEAVVADHPRIVYPSTFAVTKALPVATPLPKTLLLLGV